MRRLRDFQPVSLIHGDDLIHGTVAAVDSGEAILTLDDPAAFPTGRLPMRTKLTFAHAGHVIVLGGLLLERGAEWVRFLPDTDGLVPSRRGTPRLALALTAVAALGDGTTVATHTIDVSVGGALVASRAIGAAGAPITLTLQLPGDNPQLVARGHVVRVIPAGTAVRFALLDASDAALLRALVHDVRRALALRFAEARGTAA